MSPFLRSRRPSTVSTGAPEGAFFRIRARLHGLALQGGRGGPGGSIASGLDIALHDLAARRAGVPPQLFDLAKDPGELNDLAGTKEGQAKAVQLERLLRAICDPEAVDRQAKADQRAKAEFWGGDEAIRQEGLLVITPAPGTAAQIEKVQ